MVNSRSRPRPWRQAETVAVAPPCAMVIFGAGGDLTKRLVAPALYNLVTAKRLPDGFRLVGVDHGSRTVDDWRKSLTDMMNEFVASRDGEFQADQHRPDGLAMADRPHDLPAGRLRGPANLQPSQGASCGARQDGRHGGQPSLLSRRRGPLLQRRRRRPRGGGHGDGRERTMAARRHREAVRARPALGQGAQCRDPEDAAGASDLSNGPFPRQGDGPEHHGAALCQRPVRAAVESAAHRPRPDHRGGDGRRRTARQVLRADRRAARHGAQPRVPAAVADGDGAADLLRCRGRPRQEGGSHPGHTSGLAQARDEGRRARPVRCRHRPGQAGAGLSSASPTLLRIRTPRPTSPGSCRSTTGAGPACPSTCAREST